MKTLRTSTTGAGVRFDTRVTPRASRNAVEGVRDGRLLIKVTAPPVDAAANAAVIALLADTLTVARRDVSLVSGDRARLKSVVVAGLTETELRQRLEGH